jgi:hypothetical protein
LLWALSIFAPLSFPEVLPALSGTMDRPTPEIVNEWLSLSVAGRGRCTYCPGMRFRSCRSLIATLTAALFLLSAVTHHVMAAAMVLDSGMSMASQAADMADHVMAADHMAAHDADMPCPMSSDCSKDPDMRAMACFAHCATVLGVLADPARVVVTAAAHPLDLPLARPLVSLHGPPDSPPPKSLL